MEIIEILRVIITIAVVVRAAYTDLKTHIIEDEVTVLGVLLGLVYNFVLYIKGDRERVLFNVVLFFVYMLLFGVAGLYLRIIGGGDVKLIMALTLLVGNPGISFIIMLTSILGITYGVYLLVLKKCILSTKVALGPVICVSTLVLLVMQKYGFIV